MIEIDELTLTQADYKAIDLGDSNYINSKGVNNYVDGVYYKAVEYYHLAAAMGNVDATSNLGYCYLYGRDIDQNTSLAIAYLTIAANKGSIDGAYKLGDIYSRDKWIEPDKELSIYYYRMAVSRILEEDEQIIWNDELLRYPSLCFAMGREHLPEGSLPTNLHASYQFLLQAKKGYENDIANGQLFYKKAYENVLEYLERPEFLDIKDKYDDEDYDYVD